MEREFDKIIDEICRIDSRYKPDAYEFVMEALSFTQKKFRRQRHVSGDELLEGIRQLLMKKFGPMALSVLKHWGVGHTEDFGNIVFHLVEHKVLSKTDEDTPESFKHGYNFKEVFDAGYRKQLARRISRMRSF